MIAPSHLMKHQLSLYVEFILYRNTKYSRISVTLLGKRIGQVLRLDEATQVSCNMPICTVMSCDPMHDVIAQNLRRAT